MDGTPSALIPTVLREGNESFPAWPGEQSRVLSPKYVEALAIGVYRDSGETQDSKLSP